MSRASDYHRLAEAAIRDADCDTLDRLDAGLGSHPKKSPLGALKLEIGWRRVECRKQEERRRELEEAADLMDKTINDILKGG